MSTFLHQKVNINYATIAGQKLAKARAAKGLSIKEVADQLLLSSNQVVSMEDGDHQWFYGPRQFCIAVKKYADYVACDIDTDQLVDCSLLVGDIVDEQGQSSLIPANRLAKLGALLSDAHEITVLNIKKISIPVVRYKGFLYKVFAITFCLTVAVFSYGVYTLPRASDSTPAAPVAVDKAVFDRSAESGVAADPFEISTPYLELNTRQACWLQIEYADGKVVQQMTSPNSTLTFTRGALHGLVIGNASAASLFVDGESLSLEQFVKPNSTVARIQGKEGALLMGN